MVIQPLKVSGVQFTTNTNKQPKTNSQRVKQTSYKPTFSDFFERSYDGTKGTNVVL